MEQPSIRHGEPRAVDPVTNSPGDNGEVTNSPAPATAVRRSLFRQEAIDFQRQGQQWGRAVPLQPAVTRLTVYLLAAAVVAAIAFLFIGQYARKETAPGFLVPTSGAARVFARQPGTISAIHVRQGDKVEQGDPLLTISTDQIDAGGKDVTASVINILKDQRQALVAQIANEVQRAAAERERLSAQIRSLEAELDQLAGEQQIQRERIKLMERIASSGAQLAARGLVSELDQRRREDAVLEQRRVLISMGGQATSRQSRLNDSRSELQQVQFTQSEKIQMLRNELSGVEQRLAEMSGHRGYMVRAPITGVVSVLLASTGERVDTQRFQLEIVPSDAVLRAELLIPAKAIGFINVGQDVRLLYDAFPYQRFGTYHGHVIQVSHTILAPDDIKTPFSLKDPVYKVLVALDHESVNAFGKRVPLRPDMLLKADVILERRTFVQWMLEPLFSARIQG